LDNHNQFLDPVKTRVLTALRYSCCTVCHISFACLNPTESIKIATVITNYGAS